MGCLSGLAILILEDEPILAMDLQDILESAGATVVGPAHNVRRALQILDEREVQAAVLDVQLGDGNSYPVAERLKNKCVPWIFYTGNADESSLLVDWPSSVILRKPVSPQKLLGGLAALIKSCC